MAQVIWVRYWHDPPQNIDIDAHRRSRVCDGCGKESAGEVALMQGNSGADKAWGGQNNGGVDMEDCGRESWGCKVMVKNMVEFKSYKGSALRIVVGIIGMFLLIGILFGAQTSVALGASTSVTETDQFNYQPTYMLNTDGFIFKENSALYYVQKYAVKEKVSPALVMAIVKHETGRTFNPTSVGDGGLAIGYMQLHWDAAYDAGYRSARGDSEEYAKEDWPEDGKNPDTNIKYGIGYLKLVYNKYKDSPIYNDQLKNTISAYNLGMTDGPLKKNELNYVNPVLGIYENYGSKYYSGIEQGWPAETSNIRKHPWDGFMDFEGGTNRAVIRSTIPGLQFTTTKGLDWLYGDKQYYNVYPRGSYEANGNFFAWLGVSGDEGKIDFTKGTATYLSLLTSTESGLMIEAFDSEGNLLITSGLTGSNVGTRTFARLTVEAPGMAYVKIHDSGNYWLIDDLITDAMGVPSPHYQTAELAKSVLGKDYLLQNGNAKTKGVYSSKFVTSKDIEYLDCSGLIFWSYNKGYGATKYPDPLNPVLFEGADGQYRSNFEIFTDKDELLPGDALFFDWDGGGKMDHVVMYVGSYEYSGTIKGTEYKGTYDVVNARHPDIGIVPDTVKRLTSESGFIGYGRLIEPKVGMFALSHSPVDLIMTDPDGNTITKDAWEIPGIFYYSEWEVDNNGDHNDAITIPELKKGDYLISVIPESGALPTDTFTLEVLSNGETFILAQNVQIRDIPSRPYTVRVTDDGIEPILDTIPPNTTATLSGTLGINNWYVSNVEVNLTADDNDGGSGVDTTKYSFDDAAWTTYNSEFTITDEGTTTLYYRSSDNTGNIEPTQNQAIKIDKSPPQITINIPASEYILNENIIADWTASDVLSGIYSKSGTNPSGQPIDTSSVGTKTFTVNAEDNAGNPATNTVTYHVSYNFAGFFKPIDNIQVLNTVKAGSAVPVKFSLSGDQGLDIFATNYPASQKIDCDSNAPVGSMEETVTAGKSILSYDATTDQYNYVWKTDKAWAGSCRQFEVLLKDGTYHNANFKFLK